MSSSGPASPGQAPWQFLGTSTPNTDDRDARRSPSRPVGRHHHGLSPSFSIPRRPVNPSSPLGSASLISSLSSGTAVEPSAGDHSPWRPASAPAREVQPRADAPTTPFTEDPCNTPIPPNTADPSRPRRLSPPETESQPRADAPTTPFLEKPRDPAIPPNTADPSLKWRPLYLRPPVLLAFALLFAAFIATAQALLSHSASNNGVGTPGSKPRYVWQYGSPAVITLTMALWARVEYQAKVSAPWLRLSRGAAPPERTLLLDYVSEFQPVAIVNAFRFGDYIVGSISLVSVLLRVLVVVATAMISPAFVGVTKPETPVTLQNSFLNSPERLANVGSMPHFTMAGVVVNNLTFPDGVSKTHAYQPFTAAEVPSTAEVDITVDGLTNWLECEPADITLDGLAYVKSQWTALNVTVSTDDCELVIRVQNSALSGSRDENSYRFLFTPSSCNGSEDPDGMRIALVLAQVEFDYDSFPSEPWASNVPVNGTLGRTTQMICTPRYGVTDVRVVKNGTELISLEEVGDDMRTLSNVHAADIAKAHFDSYSSGPPGSTNDGGPYEMTTWFRETEDTIDAELPLLAAIRYRMMETDRPPTTDELLDEEYLVELVEDYYKQYTVFVAHGSLMEEASLPATGRATVMQDRLVIRSLPVHLITGLLVPCMLVAAAAAFLVPRRGILPRAPNSLVNVAALLAHSGSLLQTLRGTGAADMKTLRQRLSGSKYSTGIDYDRSAAGSQDTRAPGCFKVHGGNPDPYAPDIAIEPKKWRRPPTLNTASRIGGIVSLIALIATLEVLHRKSNAEGGIMDIRDDDNSLFWSTAIPATLLGLVAFYYSVADNTIRTLAPFVNLKRGGSFRKTVGLDVLDKSRPRIVWTALMVGDFGVLTSTITVLVGAILTIFTSGLFRPVPVPIKAEASIPTADYFISGDLLPFDSEECWSCRPETVSASLILMANLSYSPFTHEDLAFQTLDTNVTKTLLPVEDDEAAELEEMVVELTLPALRPRLDCRLYAADDITANLTLGGYAIQGTVHPLRIDVAEENCVPYRNQEYSNVVIPTADSPSVLDPLSRLGLSGDVAFGRSQSSPNVTHCSDVFYAWGSLSDANSNDTAVRNVGAVGCNETVEVVNVRVRFYGSELRIDPEDPPVVDESSAREGTAELENPMYAYLANVTSPDMFDEFFSVLVSSRYAIPASSLAEASEIESVADAIRKQHGIIRAQDINFNLRARLVDGAFPVVNTTQIGKEVTKVVTSAFGVDLEPGEAVPEMRGIATSRNVQSHRRRLVQDEATTRVLQALLSAILAFSLVSWGFTTDDRVPRSGALLSVASMGSLVAGGDILRLLPKGTEVRRAEEGFKGERFRMGWGGRKPSGGSGSDSERGGRSVGEVEGYSSAYGSADDGSYGIRVGNGTWEGERGLLSGLFARAKGYRPGWKSER